MNLHHLHEIYPAARAAAVPFGVRVDDFVFADRLDASDPVTGKLGGDLEQQVTVVYEKMAALIEGAGGELDNIGKCSAYVHELPNRELVNGEYWERVFPEKMNRPAYKVILADLPPGQLVQLDVFGILGGKRTRFDLPGVPARDPTISIGPMIFSSRCHGIDGATSELVEGGLEPEARQTFSNLRELVVAAGGSPQDIVEFNAYGKTPAYGAPTRAVFEEMFADLTPPPVLNTFVNHITPRFEISTEMVAVVGARA